MIQTRKRMNRMKTLNNRKHLRSQAFKERYLQCFGVRTNNAALLQSVVRDLIHEGISRQTLAAWAVEGGYSKGYVASLLSRILISLGLRERNKGAGRKPSLAALELLAHARSQYGEDFLKVMRAAWRAGKAQLATVTALNETSQRNSSLIVAPQLNVMSHLRHAKQPSFQTNLQTSSRNQQQET
jgi:hypothetical protein